MSENQIVSKFGRKISNSLIHSSSRDHNIITQTNSYVLNKVRALQKKLQQCGQEHLYFQMKPNKNFVIRLSTSAYELAKLIVIEHLHSESFCKDYFIASCINEDECHNQVGSSFRIFNRKKDGLQGTKLKFTVNFYHTTSTILVNGTRVDIFESELFQPICDSIQLKCDDLSIVNEQIADVLSSDCNNTNKNVTESSDKAIVYVKASEGEKENASENADKEDHISSIKSTSENLYSCPVCELSAQSGSIACEECGEWYHFKCVGLNDTSADSIHTDVPFICIYCNDNLLYDDSCVQTKNFLNLQSRNSTQNTDTENRIPSPLLETESSTLVEPQMDNTNLKHPVHDDYQNTNSVSPHQVLQNNQENNQCKKNKPKKANNSNTTNKKQVTSDSNETLIAQKYYISSLESKVNHLENTVNLLQNTLEKNPQVISSAAHDQDQTSVAHPGNVFTHSQLEYRLNLMENQMLTNLHMQNQMTLQNQMNLQSLFQCQNQLIIGLADRQHTPCARMQPALGSQYFSQGVHPMVFQHVLPGILRAPPVYHHPVVIPPMVYPQQPTHHVTQLQPNLPGPVFVQQQRPLDVPGPVFVQQQRPPVVPNVAAAPPRQFPQVPPQVHPPTSVPMPARLPTQHVPVSNTNTYTNGDMQTLPQTRMHTESYSQQATVDPLARIHISSRDECELPEPVKVHIEEKEYVCGSITNDNCIREDSVECTINLDTPEVSCEGVSRATDDLSTKNNCVAIETSVESDDQCKSPGSTRETNENQTFLSIPSLKENPPEIESLNVEVNQNVNRH